MRVRKICSTVKHESGLSFLDLSKEELRNAPVLLCPTTFQVVQHYLLGFRLYFSICPWTQRVWEGGGREVTQ